MLNMFNTGKYEYSRWCFMQYHCKIVFPHKCKISLQYHSAEDEKMPMMCYHLRSCVPKLVKRSQLSSTTLITSQLILSFHKSIFQVWVPTGEEQLYWSPVSFLFDQTFWFHISPSLSSSQSRQQPGWLTLAMFSTPPFIFFGQAHLIGSLASRFDFIPEKKKIF